MKMTQDLQARGEWRGAGPAHVHTLGDLSDSDSDSDDDEDSASDSGVHTEEDDDDHDDGEEEEDDDEIQELLDALNQVGAGQGGQQLDPNLNLNVNQ
jgi:hypothetical protein